MFKGFPEPIAVVPHPDVYHETFVPEPPITLKFIVPASSAQKLVLSELAAMGATGIGFTVTVVFMHKVLPHVFSQRA